MRTKALLVPKRVVDTRFLKKRTERVICCDACSNWINGNTVGDFYDIVDHTHVTLPVCTVIHSASHDGV